MTDVQLLTDLITTAIKGGWNMYGIPVTNWTVTKSVRAYTGIEFSINIELSMVREGKKIIAHIILPIEKILLSREFTRAIWGSEEQCRFCDKKHVVAVADKNDPSITSFEVSKPFNFHMRELVEKENFLVYLRQFVEKEEK